MCRMKNKVVLIVLLTAVSLSSGAKSYVPKPGEQAYTVLQSIEGKPLHEVLGPSFNRHDYSQLHTVDLDAAQPMQEYLGMGACLTDASAWLISRMNRRERKAFYKYVFGDLGISILRLNCGSCDYATELYNYDDTPDDVQMEHFSVERDNLYYIPVIKEMQAACPDLFTFSSIWSVPGWMKSSGRMAGGKLLDEYLPATANYWAAYLKQYKDRGVRVDAITVQNEPETAQGGGCPATLVSGEQEALLAGTLMPAAFKQVGVDAKIWIWDHGYQGYPRVLKELEDPLVRANIDAVAWHSHDGTPDMMDSVRTLYPDLPMHHTERGPRLSELDNWDEFFWSDIIFGAFNHGCSSFCTFNLLLDQDGQPNAGHFVCDGLRNINTDTGELYDDRQATIFKHVAPYVKRGARVLSIDQPDKNLRVVAFQNPGGEKVVVACCGNGYRGRPRLQIKNRGEYLNLNLPFGGWSVTTVLIP